MKKILILNFQIKQSKKKNRKKKFVIKKKINYFNKNLN